MQKSQTYSLLAVPPVVHSLLASTLRELGQDERIIAVTGASGKKVVGISVDGIMLTDEVEDNRDIINRIDEWGDLSVAIGEDAFLTGFKAHAALMGLPYDAGAAHKAWSNYDPPEELKGGI